MRKHLRSVALLVRTAFRVDPWRSLGLLVEPLGQLQFPLFAVFLKVMADGVLEQQFGLVVLGVVGITATRALRFVAVWTGSWIRIRLSEEVGFAFDREIARLASELPGLDHHERADYQDRLELLRKQQGVLGNSLVSLIGAANALVAGVGTIVTLAFASPWLLLLLLFTIPSIPIAAVRQRWYRVAEERAAPHLRMARHLRDLTVDRNAGMELRVFGLEREVISRFERAYDDARRPRLEVARRAVLLNSLRDLVFIAGFTGAVLLTLWRVSRGVATVGEFVMVVYLSQHMGGAVIGSVASVAGLGGVLRAAERMLWLQDYSRAAARTATGTRPAPARLIDGLVFEHVSFRYPGTDRWVLRDVSFRIPAGAVVALVGENGAGKTTLVKLLSRMYEPSEGRILVDGVALAEIEVNAWRARLAAAFQDFARLELTAQCSVGVGDLPRVDRREAVTAAMRRAGGSEVLGTLPAGANTMLGSRWEGGVDVSTGQWQKLALGRALMREDPLIVFFDEPTASLDALTENALFERYAEAGRAGSRVGAVTVLVSHRFSTVRSADVILVLQDGGITEMGHHNELLKRRGLYAELYALQARAYH